MNANAAGADDWEVLGPSNKGIDHHVFVAFATANAFVQLLQCIKLGGSVSTYFILTGLFVMEPSGLTRGGIVEENSLGPDPVGDGWVFDFENKICFENFMKMI